MMFSTYPSRITVVALKNRAGLFNAEAVWEVLQGIDFTIIVGMGVMGAPAEAKVLPSFSAKL